MTQMMLFDTGSLSAAPATTPAAATAPTTVATSAVPAAVTASPRQQRSRSSAPVATAASRSTPQSDDGLHTMGDLARLVLLRYQLVAKRREEMAQRRQPSASRRAV